jgi:hypothetical protein
MTLSLKKLSIMTLNIMALITLTQYNDALHSINMD